jgi:hypothetical protein
MNTVPAAKRRRAKRARATITLAILWPLAVFLAFLAVFDMAGVPRWP